MMEDYDSTIQTDDDDDDDEGTILVLLDRPRGIAGAVAAVRRLASVEAFLAAQQGSDAPP